MTKRWAQSELLQRRLFCSNSDLWHARYRSLLPTPPPSRTPLPFSLPRLHPRPPLNDPSSSLICCDSRSNELERIFPSVALEFSRLDVASLDVSVRIASFWGDAPDWPYVRPPTAWVAAHGSTQFGIAKFLPDLYRQRWMRCGGMASVMLNWVSNAVLQAGMGDQSLQLSVGMRPFPFATSYAQQVVSRNDLEATMTRLIDLVVPLGTSLALPLIAATVVLEKEGRLRALMQMMGLRMKWYWVAEWAHNTAQVLAINLAVVIFGAAAGLNFINRSMGVVLILVVLWSQCLVAMAILSSTVYNRLLTSYAGNALLMLVPALSCYFLNANITPNDTFPTAAFLLAPVAYFRAIHLLSERGYILGMLRGEMVAILLMMILDALLYLLVAAVLDLTLPREFGRQGIPLKQLLRCQRGCQRRRRATAALAPASIAVGASDGDGGDGGSGDGGEGVIHTTSIEEEDDDVRAARAIAEGRARQQPRRTVEECDPIEVAHLRKVFAGGKVAVKDLSLTLGRGECFGLLGPNGAGKTTTISMLTGLYLPDGGQARVCGFDLASELDRIYRVVGVCPQFDILWHTLTVAETLRFYCQVKGVPTERITDAAVELAIAVDLGHVLDRYVGNLSGGMKRRVSLAIALCGSPRVIFLDEPTTGLDPETKRVMWSLVDFFAKGDRCLVLTTHSMEEADALCGRIGIMAHGLLRCLGTSLHLKSKFGGGYKLEVAFDAAEGGLAAATAFVSKLLGSEAALLKQAAGVLTYQLKDAARLSDVMSGLDQRDGSARITSFALRQTSMEEVFLSIALKAELQKASKGTGDDTVIAVSA